MEAVVADGTLPLLQREQFVGARGEVGERHPPLFPSQLPERPPACDENVIEITHRLSRRAQPTLPNAPTLEPTRGRRWQMTGSVEEGKRSRR